ncbi:hypothetical protein [Burkholderia pseudomallei]|uniref:hypothetical protein n=1 Tax=Burkholderia pseudomallei TaxID=28450 RepID=UPI000F0607CD|nr:hypothetical protein [Burkholderia pseudomallei]MBF3552990.1 hypothetical protein [Burkholderia pseudomallei]MBF3757165.1 hypothetical protein [Burkholderia pseudomallei]MXP99213.1 hypothetical protein [Burkholderia pseudomallei]MXQ37095.1 hypothetical protein [Burkholderia pseudomallei]
MFSTRSHVLPRVALLGEPLANAPFVDGESWAAIPFSPLIDGILGGDVASPTRAGRRRPAAARRAKPV